MGCCVSQEPVDFTSPVDFKHFEILRAIGKGAFGKVCIVKKKDTKQMYAMKYMNKIQIIQKKAVDNIFREIQIIKSLDHPFLVNLWYAFQDEEDIFVVLDLMLGGDISYHLEKEGRFPVNRVQLYMAECALAIDYLRNKMIIHRDIKPANLLLDSKGHVHLTDFNVACIVREGRPVLSMTGTRPYMAPEVIQPSRKGYSFSVDWWSLGVSIYEMLRGERPFSFGHHMSHEAMYNMLTTVRPPASARWDDATCNVLKMLLHPDPKKRLSSLEDAKTHRFFEGLNWDKVLQKETSPAYVPSQNRIHCDPTHELEEMIVEPNPLHKKRSRLSKRRRNGMEEGLVSELNKISNRFVAYDRFRDSLAALESHEAEEKEKQAERDSLKPSTLVVDDESEKQLSATSLPKQNSVSNCDDSMKVHLAEAEVHGELDTDKSLQDLPSSPNGLKAISTIVEETPAMVDELKEPSNDGVRDKQASSSPNKVETVPVISEQTPAIVEELGESPKKDAHDQRLSKGRDSLEEVPAVPEQTPTGTDGSREFHGDKVSDKQNEVSVLPVVAAEIDSGSNEERELIPTGPDKATPVDETDLLGSKDASNKVDSGGNEEGELIPTGPDKATPVDETDLLGSKDASNKENDHFGGNKFEVGVLEESPSKETNNDGEGLQQQVDMDITESSSNRDYNEETPLIAGNQQCPSDSLEPAPLAEPMSQVEEQQSNCTDSIDDDLIKQS